MSERELAVSVTKVALCAGDGRKTITDGAGATAEAFEHFRAQPARSAQLPFACLSQCSIFSQQSDCIAADAASGERTNALAPATGDKASDMAIKAMRMARTRLIASTYQPRAPPRQVTGL